MKGALIFLAVFAILLVATLANISIPPGQAIYNAVLPGTEVANTYLVLGSVPAINLIISVFNGVIYGFIAWLIYTLLFGRKEKKEKEVNVNVTVNNTQPPTSSPPAQA
jgi:hypothetical protein